jgi:hypothetical protein
MFFCILDIIMSNVKHQFIILSITGDNYITWNNNLIEYLACEGLDKILEGDNTTVGPGELAMKKSRVNRIIKHHLDLMMAYRQSTQMQKIPSTMRQT